MRRAPSFATRSDKKGTPSTTHGWRWRSLKSAIAEGVLERTPEIDQTLADLRLALEQDEGQKLGGKSAEAARFITRRLDKLLEDA